MKSFKLRPNNAAPHVVKLPTVHWMVLKENVSAAVAVINEFE